MSEKTVSKHHIESDVMSAIRSGEVRMRPKWYFWLGSAAMVAGIAALTVLSAFLISLTVFSLRSHGPMGTVRYQQLIGSFPWWAPVLAVAGIAGGVLLLRRYDFSYKHNFIVIIIGLAAAVLLAGILADYTGLDTMWATRGPMRGLYQMYGGNSPGEVSPGMMRGPGYGRGR